MSFSKGVSPLATLTLAATTAFGPVSWAQDYPNRPVKIVVASVAGSAPDVLARVIAERLGKSLGQPVVVDNKPGAGGVVGIDAVAKATPDGYTLAIGHDGTMAINTIVYKSLPYNPATDFAAIAPLGFNEFVLITHPGTGVRTVQEMITYTKGRPGKVSYGSAGVGTPNHLFMEQLLKAAAISMTHVPYKGGAGGGDRSGRGADGLHAGRHRTRAPAHPVRQARGGGGDSARALVGAARCSDRRRDDPRFRHEDLVRPVRAGRYAACRRPEAQLRGQEGARGEGGTGQARRAGNRDRDG